ncbi:hypothetical protein PNI0009_01257 [Streptococcus pneumoniae PNI0009]|nr:hypothetical protein PCS125219_01355 [Streptococcus pneumoniae PCS125219]ELU77673.1 hypothetical protein PNI0010_00324 [Streptococcus pneumoniae PNI0010]ELU80586.1 hypothetical protein PNI0009_01257 [Streptococcus pneumoniae PNI0009]
MSFLFPCSIFLHYISNQLLCQNSRPSSSRSSVTKDRSKSKLAILITY